MLRQPSQRCVERGSVGESTITHLSTSNLATVAARARAEAGVRKGTPGYADLH